MDYILFQPGLNRVKHDFLVRKVTEAGGILSMSELLPKFQEEFSFEFKEAHCELILCNETWIKNTERWGSACPLTLFTSDVEIREWVTRTMQELRTKHGEEILWTEFAAKFKKRFYYSPEVLVMTKERAQALKVIAEGIGLRSGLVFAVS